MPLPDTGVAVSALPVASSPDAFDALGVQGGVTKKLSSTLLATQAELDAHAHTGTYVRISETNPGNIVDLGTHTGPVNSTRARFLDIISNADQFVGKHPFVIENDLGLYTNAYIVVSGAYDAPNNRVAAPVPSRDSMVAIWADTGAGSAVLILRGSGFSTEHIAAYRSNGTDIGFAVLDDGTVDMMKPAVAIATPATFHVRLYPKETVDDAGPTSVMAFAYKIPTGAEYVIAPLQGQITTAPVPKGLDTLVLTTSLVTYGDWFGLGPTNPPFDNMPVHGTKQFRVVAQFINATAADVLEISWSGIGATLSAAGGTNPDVVKTAWTNIGGTAIQAAPLQVRNQTAARGKVMAAWVEARCRP